MLNRERGCHHRRAGDIGVAGAAGLRLVALWGKYWGIGGQAIGSRVRRVQYFMWCLPTYCELRSPVGLSIAPTRPQT